MDNTSASEPADPASLCELLDRVAPRDGQSSVSVEGILERIGNRSFAAAILVAGLILVSPVSGIPGVPTVGGTIIVLIAVQALIGRNHLWLPGFLMHRRIGADRMRQGLNFLSKPAAWVDRHSRNRWRVLTHRPMKWVTLVSIVAVAFTWPLLELLPFFTSAGAIAVSLFAIGLMVHDGIYVIAGYIFAALVAVVVLAIWQGVM